MRSIDAMGAFSHLSDNIPAWITRVSELAAYTAAKNAEYAEAYRKHAKKTPRRQKNTSICSIRTEDLNKPLEQVEATDQSAKDLLQDAVSLVDSNNQLHVVSTRHNVIIQYDGHSQQSLEEFVRSIGTARNNIRKAKISSQPLAGFRSGVRSTRSTSPLAQLAENDDPIMPNIRSARRNAPQTPQQDSPFELADKHLEVAHSLCETAAHQFMRTGDCSKELAGVEDKFKALLDMANTEVQRLKEEQKEQPPEEQPNEEEDKPQGSTGGTIEVDDSSDVSIESIDLTAFRVNRNRYRA